MDWTYMRGAGIALVAALALGLAGCSSSGKDDPPEMEMAETDTPEEAPEEQAPAEQIAALQEKINELRAQLGLEPVDIDDLTGTVESLTAEAASLQKRIDDAAEEERLAQEEADRMAAEEAAKARTKLGKDMYAALDGPPTPPTATALNNLFGDRTLTDEILRLPGLVAGVGSLPDDDATPPGPVTLDIGDSVDSLSGWEGFRYSHTDPESGIVNEAVIYTNRGPGKPKSFADTEHVIQSADDSTEGHIKGYVTLTEDDADTLALVRAEALTHSGTQTHQPAPRNDAVYIRGTFYGAPGEYRCTGTCSSTNDGKDGPSELKGEWHFKPDPGAVAHMPDADYLFYGWWVRKDSDGVPNVASALYGSVGNFDRVDTTTEGIASGTATYVGKAAGLFALNDPVAGTGDGGQFTADAKLEATFGDKSDSTPDAGVEGTIDNFRLNDGSEDPGWSVKLTHKGWAAGGRNDFTGVTDGTVWSIDGNEAQAVGAWRVQMYDEKPGNPPDGDGSNVPTSLTGYFYTEFNDQGRMVGAFGADRQEE